MTEWLISLKIKIDHVLSVGGQPRMAWVLAPLVPVSHLYGWGMRLRQQLYASGVLAQRSLPVRVISVGNLTTGGTGKTPLVIALANTLRESGCRVGVISRGYGRRTSEMVEVSDGTSIQSDPKQTGDEPLVIAQRCPGVPVAVDGDRYVAGRYLLEKFGIDTLVLDDGFQHLALRRDVDILILDATVPLGNDYLLPRGRLREPEAAIARASLLVVTRSRQALDLADVIDRIRAAAPQVPLCAVDFTATALVVVGGTEKLGPAVLKGERILAVSGIGNPDSFQRLLVALGATVAAHCVFPDHHDYSKTDLARIRKAAEQVVVDRIVTTEKDAVKLARLNDRLFPGHGLWAVTIEPEWLEGRNEWLRAVSQN
jgi:tetraacyldisaccharide 4'-kinase